MVKIALDGVEYDSEQLSDNAKAQVASLQFLQVHMQTLRNEIAALNASKELYLAAFRKAVSEGK